MEFDLGTFDETRREVFIASFCKWANALDESVYVYDMMEQDAWSEITERFSINIEHGIPDWVQGVFDMYEVQRFGRIVCC